MERSGIRVSPWAWAMSAGSSGCGCQWLILSMRHDDSPMRSRRSLSGIICAKPHTLVRNGRHMWYGILLHSLARALLYLPEREIEMKLGSQCRSGVLNGSAMTRKSPSPVVRDSGLKRDRETKKNWGTSFLVLAQKAAEDRGYFHPSWSAYVICRGRPQWII